MPALETTGNAGGVYTPMTQWAAVTTQLAATRVPAQPPGLEPSLEPKLSAPIQGYLPFWVKVASLQLCVSVYLTTLAAPPTILVRPSIPHVHSTVQQGKELCPKTAQNSLPCKTKDNL